MPRANSPAAQSPAILCVVPPIFWLLIVDVIIVAPITAWLANEKGRSPTLWFLVAAIGGPITLLAVGRGPARWDVEEAVRRVRRCPDCDTRISLVATRCPACWADLPPTNPGPTPVPAPRSNRNRHMQRGGREGR
jgi:hypothetical protein